MERNKKAACFCDGFAPARLQTFSNAHAPAFIILLQTTYQ
jgi:hypothetical protein